MNSRISKDRLSLSELIFHSEQFCSRVQFAIEDAAPNGAEDEEMRLQIGQAKNYLKRLHEAHDADVLSITNKAVASDFRRLIVSLLWIAFHGRRFINSKLFGLLVMIESEFAFLLMSRR